MDAKAEEERASLTPITQEDGKSCASGEPSGTTPNRPVGITTSISADNQEINMERFPESIYGAGMSFIVQSATTSDSIVHWLSGLIFFAIFFNILMQVCAIWSVKIYIAHPAVMEARSLYEEFTEQTYDEGVFDQDAFEQWDKTKRNMLCQLPLSQPFFTLIVIVIWTMSLVIEIKETVLFSVWWLQLPKCEDGQGDVSLSKQEEANLVLVQRASSRMKTAVFCAILLPKLMIGLFLRWMGARWLVATPDLQGLVLNAVALSFIVDLDEMTFHALVPHRAKRTMEMFQISVPAPQGNSRRKVIKWMAQMGGALTVLVVVPTLYLGKFQQALPGYRFDVRPACTAMAAGHGL